MFLTETAQHADVVLPAASLYEKSGTVTNAFGDLQLVKKAADRAGVRTDLELIVQLAGRMGADVSKLTPFGQGTRADMGQSRGAQSGEADRNAVMLAAHNLGPKLGLLDPSALLDEIQRLVPGYGFSRMELFAGNDQRVQPTAHSSHLVQISNRPERLDGVLPSQDTLFSSGTLGRYSRKLTEVSDWQSKRSMMAAD
jgi:NADH-quinone oxidoreductase subunit G